MALKAHSPGHCCFIFSFFLNQFNQFYSYSTRFEKARCMVIWRYSVMVALPVYAVSSTAAS